MATPIHTRLTGDIWDWSVDELLAPMTEMPRLGGSGPFVINLSTASTPIEAAGKSLPGIEKVHVYQIQRIEDRRPRYRLRVGPFTNEDDADAALIKAREIFPGALTATAGDDDLQAIGMLQTRANTAVARPVPQPAATEIPRAVTATTAAGVAITAPTAPVAAATPAPTVPTAPPVLTAAVVPPVSKAAVAAPSAVATPVAPAATRAAKTPSQSLQPLPKPMPTPMRRPAPAAFASTAAAPARAPAPLPPQAGAPARALASPSPLGRAANAPIAPAVRQNLESTQTVRPLTPLELAADDQSQWYVIQLSTADQAFDPETLPNLDIFSVYRLYSVAGLEQERVVHALRLGFFGAEIAARAVMSYVSAYYDKATITRVSVAERERFATQCLEARKDVGATGRHAVIEITDERVVRTRRPGSLNDLRRDPPIVSASP